MMRWLAAGVLAGVLGALVAFAPAAWLARWVDDGTDGRLLLADARGTLWSGSATPVLTGGEGSREASALPGRLQWRIGPGALVGGAAPSGMSALSGLALLVRAEQACCLNGTLRLRVVPGFSGVSIELLPREGGGAIGQWPASWLSGLGTPWNTLQPEGTLQLESPGFTLQAAGGRWRFSGRAAIDLDAFSSRLSTLDVLGSYHLVVAGDAARGVPAGVTLTTTRGPLLLNGSGELLGSGAALGLRFRGTAGAAPGQEGVLNNLLNILGRRQGAQTLISIG